MIIPHYNSLKTLIEDRLTSFKKVDWFNNQYERYEDLKATALPACYIEFPSDIDWQQVGNNVQYAEVDIVLHLVVFDVKDAPVSILNIASDTFKELNTQTLWDETEQLSTELVRVKSSLTTNYDQLKVVKMTFRTNIADISGAKETAPVNATFVIN